MEFNTSYVNSSLPSNISFVEEIEDELVNALIGNTVLLVFFMICGAFGNCMVLFVYKDYKFSSNKIDDRRFIPYLALVDFMASLTSCCQYVIENQYPLRYPGKFSCKVLNFYQHVSGIHIWLDFACNCVPSVQESLQPFLAFEYNTKSNYRCNCYFGFLNFDPVAISE